MSSSYLQHRTVPTCAETAWKGINLLKSSICFAVSPFLSSVLLINGCRHSPPKNSPARSTIVVKKQAPIQTVDGPESLLQNYRCGGKTGDEERSCICPSPLNYTMNSLSGRAPGTFETEVDMKKSDRPIYKVRIVSLVELIDTNEFSTLPAGGKSMDIVEKADYDPFNLIISSSAPKDEFKLKVMTSEALKIKCVNQEK